jgi:deoxycytidine triphosphate deaminase
VILTDREIQIALTEGQIIIDPAPTVLAYSSTSVDLTLESHISEFDQDIGHGALELAIDPQSRNICRRKNLRQDPETNHNRPKWLSTYPQ